MFLEAGNSEFNHLSLSDLLKARDQFHVHLMHKANVVGTAVGLYLIRRSDPEPVHGIEAPLTTKKEPRTFENSEVRDYSWPCVLVVVSEWLDETAFGASNLSDFIPKTIYLEDGRSVPVCIVLAPLVEAAPPPLDESALAEADGDFSGGIAVTSHVQGMRHVASLGCLVTDGHTLYGLTNRHVCGKPGEKIYAFRDGDEVEIGHSSEKQLTRLPFETLYPGWPSRNVFVHLDAGLVELRDRTQWRASIQGIGPIGPLADLSTYNISLKLIDAPVRAHGCMSGALLGKISALFYRFKSVAGFEYIADFLIGSRDANPLQTRPGDSGSVWVVDDAKTDTDDMPIGLQWGGTVFSADTIQFPFALATNLSNVLKELDLDLYRGEDAASFDYWGPVGHYTIGGFACPLVTNANLLSLMTANRLQIGFNSAGSLSSATSFFPLSDVPDTVWKGASRGSREKPTHYADMDFADSAGNTLFSLVPNAAALDVTTWQTFYNSIGWTQARQRGLLPFRVWQIYKEMVGFVLAKDVPQFVAAAGILAHYVGDACQPLHGSYLDDGDPFRNPNGSPSPVMLGHGHGFANGIHSAYESQMLKVKKAALHAGLSATIGANHGMPLITTGREAGYAIVQLMQRTRQRIPPMDIVNFYGAMVLAGTTNHASNNLWNQFGADTIDVVADGCRTLAMLWDSAWAEGNGNLIPTSELGKVHATTLKQIYKGTGPFAGVEFLLSCVLDTIEPHL